MNNNVSNKPDQIEQIYREHKEDVYNYIYRLSSDPNQAQDVTQHTFLKIMTDPGLCHVENLKSYLFTIARNHLYDTWKKKKETLVDDAGIDIAASADEGELSEELARQQAQQAVVFCVQRLSDKFRELMILRYMQDLSIQEIASITELSQSDIKVSLLRARQQFDRGLTQHMYLKVAKTRQQCTEMNSMLTPYQDVDIPESELTAFAKHIDKCPICAEDAEELKRTRKLLALIPLVGVPLSLDTSMNDAMAATDLTSKPVPDVNTAGNTLLVKAGVSVAVVVLVVGGVMLLPDKQQVSKPTDTLTMAPSMPQSSQKVEPQAQQPAVQSPSTVQSTATGSVAVNAKARLTSGSPPVTAHWDIFKVSANQKDQDQWVAGVRSEELNRKLDPGQYKVKARIARLEQERIIEVVAGQPLSLDYVFNAAELHVSTPLVSSIKLYDSHLTYKVSKSRQDMQAGKYMVIKKFTQPASTFFLSEGDYYLKASYMGFGDIESEKSFAVKSGETINIDIPVKVGMFKPEVILSSKNLSHIRNISWSIKKSPMPENSPTGFVLINNNVETPMMPGKYTLVTKLENITQQSEVTIKEGQINPHNVILRGGIVNASAWLDSSKSKRNKVVYVNLYDFEKFSQASGPGDYIPKLATIVRNENRDIWAILPEGKYILVAKNKIGHKVRATREFTVKDGDNKQIDLIIGEQE